MKPLVFPCKSFQCDLEVLLEHHKYYCKELLQCSFFWVNRNMFDFTIVEHLKFFIMGRNPDGCASVNNQGPADGQRQLFVFSGLCEFGLKFDVIWVTILCLSLAMS